MGNLLAPILGRLFMSKLEENIHKYNGRKPDIYYIGVEHIYMITN